MPKSKKVLKSRQDLQNEATDKEMQFLRHYLETGSQSEAYKKVYNPKMESYIARTSGSRLFSKPRVYAAYLKMKEERDKNFHVEKKEIVKILLDRVQAKLTDVMEWDDKKITFKKSSELTEATLKNVASIEISETKWGTDKRARLKDDSAALALIAKYVGLLEKDPDDDSGRREDFTTRLSQASSKL